MKMLKVNMVIGVRQIDKEILEYSGGGACRKDAMAAVALGQGLDKQRLGSWEHSVANKP
jgi:hypothetical protein